MNAMAHTNTWRALTRCAVLLLAVMLGGLASNLTVGEAQAQVEPDTGPTPGNQAGNQPAPANEPEEDGEPEGEDGEMEMDAELMIGPAAPPPPESTKRILFVPLSGNRLLPLSGTRAREERTIRRNVTKGLGRSRRSATRGVINLRIDLGEEALPEDNFAAMAANLGVDGVLDGSLFYQSGRYELRLRLRSAVDGTVLQQLELDLGRRPRVGRGPQRAINRALWPVIETLGENGGAEGNVASSGGARGQQGDGAGADSGRGPTRVGRGSRRPAGSDDPEPPEDLGDDDDDDDDDDDEDEDEDEDSADSDDPALPEGLGGDGSAGNGDPALPEGLGGSLASDISASGQEETSLLETLGLTGFVDLRNGVRIQEDPHEERESLIEVRLQLAVEKDLFDFFTIDVAADFLLDRIEDESDIDLELGYGPIDLREANVSFTPISFVDLKIGRQVLTWGTADFVFLNDLFPKDFRAFFIGRDTPYLKAPSDAAKMSIFTSLANLDLVYVPRFDPDRFITGERLSFYHPTLQELAGQNAILEFDAPDEWFRDHEGHARLSANIQGMELAAYGYYGFWKSPGGLDPDTGIAQFPRLAVYGASIRDAFLSGIASIEGAYYDSLDDDTGRNTFINNDEARFLVGYERELPVIAQDLSFWAQYYAEYMKSYKAYEANLPDGIPARTKIRHLVTLRLTKLLLSQTMTASLLTAYSPSDKDAYLRPVIDYKTADCCSLTIGGNFFFGSEDYTFLNQLQNNANVYAAMHYAF